MKVKIVFFLACARVHLDFSSQCKSKYWESGHTDIILSNTTENDKELWKMLLEPSRTYRIDGSCHTYYKILLS